MELSRVLTELVSNVVGRVLVRVVARDTEQCMTYYREVEVNRVHGDFTSELDNAIVIAIEESELEAAAPFDSYRKEQPKRDYVRKYLDASTSHITKEDAELLDGPAPVPVRLNREEGAFIHVAQYEHQELEGQIVAVRKEGFSAAFARLLRFARANHCDWILLDRDADVLPGLETFDW